MGLDCRWGFIQFEKIQTEGKTTFGDVPSAKTLAFHKNIVTDGRLLNYYHSVPRMNAGLIITTQFVKSRGKVISAGKITDCFAKLVKTDFSNVMIVC